MTTLNVEPGSDVGNRSSFKGFRAHLWVLLGMWTAAVAAALLWNLFEERRQIFEIGRRHADTAYRKDLVYRRWMADHGGVYVRVTDESLPSPYLAGVPERDIDTSLGKLTLVNPATANRQVYEMEAKASGVRSHVTSLNPINPQNAPDPWESEALRALEGGQPEFCAVQQMADGSYIRLMRPLLTEANCLNCHAEQGYKVGDVRGGISVSVPLEPLWNAAKMKMLAVSMGHGLLWVIGLAGIGLGVRDLRKEVGNRLSAQEQLKENEILLRTVTERNARLSAEREVAESQAKLRVAGQIQKRLLPDSAPLISGFDLAGISNPAEVTSGDYYDFVTMPDGCLGIVVADVSGHGTGPALLATEACSYLRVLAATRSDVGEILTHLNKLLLKDIEDGYFVTLFLGRLNPADRSFVFASAGHESHLLGTNGEVTKLAATGLPLGISADWDIATGQSITLQAPQCILFLTDGILEETDGNGSCYGIQRALDLVQVNRGRPACEIVDELLRAAAAFSGDAPPSDDMTAVILRAE